MSEDPISGDESIPYDERPSDGADGKVVPLRLQRFLARCGVASRRASENLMTAGRVTVNGAVVTELGTKVDPLKDEVAVDGRVVAWDDHPVTLMLHKPAGVISTMKPQSAKAIVADLVPLDVYPGLYPIGRLDGDTTGLLLFSTDGALGHGLLHPSHHVPKTYVVHLGRPLSSEAAEELRSGVLLEDGLTQPAELEFESGDGRVVSLTIREGRYHQVKRMFEAVGFPLQALHRRSFGPLELGELDCGSWRILSDDEVSSLRRAAGL